MKNIFLITIFISLQFLSAIGQEKSSNADLLMQIDREFDKATAATGIEGWVTYFAPNGSMITDTVKPVTGPSEIRAVMKTLFEDSTFSLRWAPVKGEILIPEVLGYTVGRYIRFKNKEGKKMKWTGTYSTIWKKQPGGSWKIVLDTGESDGPPVEVK